MSATISDYFNKAADGNGNYPILGTVSATRASGGATLSCEDLTGWTTETPVHFSAYKLNADGAVDTTTQTDWKGIVSGNTITNLTRVAGAADTGNTVGDIVELNPTIGWLDDLVTGLSVTHKQDGTLKDNVVGSNNISSATIPVNNITFTTGVGTVSNRQGVIKGGVAYISATFQVTTAFTENTPFAVIAGISPLARAFFIMSGGKLGFIEPDGKCHGLNGLAQGWWSMQIIVPIS